MITADQTPVADTENYPHVAIIDGGIGGVALAVACLHRGIPLRFMNVITTLILVLRAIALPCRKRVKPSKAWVFSPSLKALSPLLISFIPPMEKWY
ncbi:hypothetical protein [Oceanisphaera ostreae]|uniref:FAD-binding domain-containing protein n=1 Tax=Oceanisphaera ostreae TaxID=914151 RepID=A0ABW3KDU1_9GAMM